MIRFLPNQANICDSDKEDARQALLMNPSYMKIGPAITQLEGLLACWRRLAADGSGPALEAPLVQTAKAAVATGVDTVGTTFALYHLYHKIPKEVITSHINIQ